MLDKKIWPHSRRDELKVQQDDHMLTTLLQSRSRAQSMCSHSAGPVRERFSVTLERGEEHHRPLSPKKSISLDSPPPAISELQGNLHCFDNFLLVFLSFLIGLTTKRWYSRIDR